jgi:cell pole-organizing protein PopZ
MAKEQDQSMEEILQSIKRIIAEEGEPAPSGSDVLELTDLLSEDTNDAADSKTESLSIEEIMAAPIEPEYHLEPTKDPEPKQPVKAVDTSKPARESTPASAVDTSMAARENKPVEIPTVEASRPRSNDIPKAAPTDAPLASAETISTASAAMSALRNAAQELPPLPPTSSMRFRSGETVEDLVLEALRPMLKDWIDSHMTPIVERMVEREIRRLNGGR